MRQPLEDAIDVRLVRTQIWKQIMTPGFAWKWNYEAWIPEIRLTAGNGLSESDERDLPFRVSDSSLREARKTIKRVAPNARIIESWRECSHV